MPGAIRAGRAFVELYVEQAALYRGLQEAEDRFRQWVQNVGLLSSAAGAGILAGLIPALNQASDQAENLSAFQEVFRGANKEANALADTLARRVGRSTVSIAQGMTPIGAMVRGLGLAGDEAARFAAAATQASLDISSFFNSNTADAMTRVRSALSGSSEAVDQFGINLRQQALSLKLTEMGYSGNIQEASELEKTLARLEIIQESLARSGAAGDLERTKDQYANLTRTLADSIQTLMAAAGNGIRPIAEQLVAGIVSVTQAAARYIQQAPALIQGLAGVGAAALVGGAGLAVMASDLVHFAANLTLAAIGLAKALPLLRQWTSAALSSSIATQALSLSSKALSTAWSVVPAKGLILRAVLVATGAVTWGVVAAFAAVTAAAVAVGAWFYGIHQRTGALNPLLEALATVGQRLAAVWSENVMPVFEKLGILFSGLFGGQADYWSGSIEKLADVLGDVLVFAAEAAAGAIALIADSISWVIDGINSLLGIETKPRPKSGQATQEGEDAEQPASEPEMSDELKDWVKDLKKDIKTPAEEFASELQNLNDAMKANAINADDYAKGLAKAEKERDDKIKQAYDASDEGKEEKRLKEQMDKMAEDVKTPAEKFADTIADINKALGSQQISQEMADRFTTQAETDRNDAQKQIDDSAKRDSENARKEELDKINKQFERRYTLSKALSGSDPDRADKLETETLRRQFVAQRDAGFKDEAFGTLTSYLGAILDRSGEIDKKVKEQGDEADLITGSAQEAAFGLGTKTIDDQLLEEQKELVKKSEAARELLDKIVKIFEAS